MARFRYNATDAQGREVAGQLEAVSADEARRGLERQGLVVRDVSPVNGELPSSVPLAAGDAEELAQKVAQATTSDVPLALAFRAAAEESSNRRVAATLVWLADRIDEGRSLEEALSAANGPVPRYLRSLVVAAARTGSMGESLVELVNYYRQTQALRRTIVASFSYPLVVASIAAALFSFIILYFGSAHERTWHEFGMCMPMLTRVFIWWRHVGLWLVLGAAAVLVLLAAVYRQVCGRAAWLRFLATIPVFGPLAHWSGLAQWCGLLSVLVKHQVPLPEALRYAGEGMVNAYVGRLSSALADGVARGRTISQLLSANRKWPASLVPLVRWGEQTGMLADSLRTGSEMFQQRVRRRSLMVQSVLPSILFLAIGCGILFVAGAVFVPIFSLISALS